MTITRLSIVCVLLFATQAVAQCSSNTAFPAFPEKNDAIQTNGFISRDQSTEKVTLRYPEPLAPGWDTQTNCPHDQNAQIWPQGVTVNGNTFTVPNNQAVKICGQSSIGTPQQPVRIIVSPNAKLIIGDADLDIHSTGIYVDNGELLIGSSTCRLRSKINITLYSSGNQLVGSEVFINKGILVSGGTLDIHGARYSNTWSRLSKRVEAGDTSLYLQDTVNWEAGQEIVITTSHLKDSQDFHENDVVTIASVEVASNGMSKITVTSPVQFDHFAGSDYQVEVGLLSRRIKIQGDASSELGSTNNCTPIDRNDPNESRYSSIPCREALRGFGGHIRVQGSNAIGRVSGVELYRMGKTNVLGQYPMHFHMMNSSPESYFTDSSVHRSFFRCISIHGTHDTLIQENVAYDAIGHCYYLEDGIEQRNKFMYNLAAHVHFLGKAQNSYSQFMDFVNQSDDLLLPADVTASGFYITNTYNTFIGNAASGGYAGFAIVKLPKSLKENFGMVEPEKFSFYPYEGGFDGNSCHSSGWWWDLAGCIYAGGLLEHYNPNGGSVSRSSPLRYNPGRVQPARDTQCDGVKCFLIFTNTKIFLSSWGVNNWGERSEFRGLEIHNVNRGLGLLGQHYLTDMLAVCRSAQHQPSQPRWLSSYEKRYWSSAYDFFAWYDTGQQHIVTNTVIRNCGSAARGAPVWRYLTHSDRHVPEFMQITKNIQYQSSDQARYLIRPTVPGANTVSARYASWYDADGSVLGTGRPTLLGSAAPGAGKWWTLDSSCVPHAGSELVACGAVSPSGRPRSVGSVHLYHHQDQKGLESTEALCGNGSGVPCPTLGHLAHFGTPSAQLRTDGLQISWTAKVTGPAGGFGWYLAIDQGPPRRLDIDRAAFQGPALDGQMMAVSYPKGSRFEIRYLTRYCHEGDQACGHELYQQVGSPAAVRDGPGNQYHFDDEAELLYFKVLQSPYYRVVWDPEARRRLPHPFFEREGLRVPMLNYMNYIRILADCNDGVPMPQVGRHLHAGEGGGFSYCAKPSQLNIPSFNDCDDQGAVPVAYDDCGPGDRETAPPGGTGAPVTEPPTGAQEPDTEPPTDPIDPDTEPTTDPKEPDTKVPSSQAPEEVSGSNIGDLTVGLSGAGAIAVAGCITIVVITVRRKSPQSQEASEATEMTSSKMSLKDARLPENL